MNNENVKEEVIEIIDNAEVEVYDETEESNGGGLLGTIGILAVCGAAAAAALHFTRKKREEMTIKKLEKKGYIVTKAEDKFDDEDDFEDEFDSENENEK